MKADHRLRQPLPPGKSHPKQRYQRRHAAEPVRERTVCQFEDAFILHNVLTAGYGLAEATVGVSMSAPGTGLRVDKRDLVSVGKPFPGVYICIVAGGDSLPAGEIGEIAIRSIANSPGYLNNPGETGKIAWKDGFFPSGDMGCLIDKWYCLWFNFVEKSAQSIFRRNLTRRLM